jgi:prepilin-type N-terminal cleavage/methylation domain-containing protein
MALFMEDLPPTKILPNAVKAFNKKGFTLIEVVVATLILGVLAAGVAGAFWNAQRLLNLARHRMQAYNFSAEALDRLKSNYQYYSNPSMNIGNDHDQSEIEASGILKGEITNLGGTLKYDVTEPQVNGYKQVTIKVHWDEATF